jgi:hypothetical protein
MDFGRALWFLKGPGGILESFTGDLRDLRILAAHKRHYLRTHRKLLRKKQPKWTNNGLNWPLT